MQWAQNQVCVCSCAVVACVCEWCDSGTAEMEKKERHLSQRLRGHGRASGCLLICCQKCVGELQHTAQLDSKNSSQGVVLQPRCKSYEVYKTSHTEKLQHLHDFNKLGFLLIYAVKAPVCGKLLRSSGTLDGM